MVRIKRVADLATDSPRWKVAGSRTEAANHRFHGLFRVRCRAPQPNRLEGERFGEPSAAGSTPATVRLLRAPRTAWTRAQDPPVGRQEADEHDVRRTVGGTLILGFWSRRSRLRRSRRSS